MYYRGQKLFYGLSMFLLLAALFVMQDSHVPRNTYHVTQFKQEVRTALARGFIQTVGDGPFMTGELVLIFDSADNFYKDAAREMMALLEPRGADDDIIKVGREVFLAFGGIKNYELRITDSGKVAGKSTDFEPQSAIRNPQSDENLTKNNKFMTEEPIWNIVPIRVDR
ncbi:MAG: hypothetical protein A3H72_01330 [Candidatus Doudnabacteria bacterium RIFCSPLOWO2_02_FULL_48_8]|uniref:Uncharacterized protein n=1 Tax=Candidatus Doudnabacteria bacterium RIFCSPHIGHO2_01_FULL_46_24 TaxID=1817825 RepID=A0A1F5NUE7_9BACT|nr:MAG: hypothetical protein A2720_01755 [Candidatus Doudnabacteria bacterium RIFCSPHIGHO2_01_FULL_46_24]OGE95172.1 MAG: hypothetical protein A3H72_01330 [Candidatus Doudnabacteria bacterium RIFCSPLOWO2_02_FULL_48_8]